MTRQRLTKRQIREDPLVTFAYEARSWASKNGTRIVVVAAAIVVAVGLVTAMRNARRGAERDASAQLAQAQFQLWGDSSPQALQMADDVIARWPGTKSAQMAQLVRGDALLSTDQPAEALNAYQAFLAKGSKQPILVMTAMRGEAAAFEESGRFTEAAAAYEQLAREFDSGSAVSMDLGAAARCLERGGDTAKARTIYRELLDDHPDLQDRTMVELRLHALGDSNS